MGSICYSVRFYDDSCTNNQNIILLPVGFLMSKPKQKYRRYTVHWIEGGEYGSRSTLLDRLNGEQQATYDEDDELGGIDDDGSKN